MSRLESRSAAAQSAGTQDRHNFEALTVGIIARRLSVPVHRVSYIIRTRDLKPQFKAGSSYVYDEATVEVIAAELRGKSRIGTNASSKVVLR